MADDQERRTEPPSPRRLREARRKGKIARSRDLAVWVNLASALAVFWIGRDFWIAQLESLAARWIDLPLMLAQGGPQEIASVLLPWARSLLLLALPVPIACLVTSILVNGIFNGWLFAPAAAAPDFDRLNPTTNLRRMFALDNWIELGKSILKILILIAGLCMTIAWALPNLIRIPMMHSANLAGALESVLSAFLIFILAGLGLFAIFDVWYQRFSYLRNSRMTPEEKKRDRRQDEGDPEQRARRRQLLRELTQDSPLERCQYASMIVCATAQSMAVAIHWDGDSRSAAWLLNKGRDSTAQAIVQIARENRIALIEDAELCRRIYGQTGIDADLSADLLRDLLRYR